MRRTAETYSVMSVRAHPVRIVIAAQTRISWDLTPNSIPSPPE